MPTAFFMPKFDMDQEAATVVRWIKGEGDLVEQDEPVLLVETDKVAIEVPSPATGRLVAINVNQGDVVPVTEVIAFILGEGETEADLPERKAASTSEGAKEKEVVKPAEVAVFPAEAGLPAATKPPAAVTPVAARMAQALGVDLSAVPAQGERVTKADIEQYLQRPAEEAGRVQVAATPAARRLSKDLQVELDTLAGSGPRGRVQAEDVTTYAARKPQVIPPMLTSAPGERSATLIPLVGIRRTIASRMQASFQTAPHQALTVNVEVTQLEAARQRLNTLAARLGEQKVSLTAILVRMVAWALERNPYLNASLVDETIHLWQDINVGVATAIDDGLIVPIIRDANHKSINQINAELKDLADRARAGALTLPEVKDGTFTISNLGMFGIDQFRAIINPPESGILAVGRVVRKPVVVDDQDTLSVRPIMSLTLSADHRIVDGVVAARFLGDLVQAIEVPESLLY